MASQCSQSALQCSKTPATPAAKRNTWTTTEEKEFLLICKERAFAEELDNCVRAPVLVTSDVTSVYIERLSFRNWYR